MKFVQQDVFESRASQTFYGQHEQSTVSDELDLHVEELAVRGYTVVADLLTAGELETWRRKIDEVYQHQESGFGHDELVAIGDLDVARAPLLYDFDFVSLAQQPRVLGVVGRFLGEWFILNVQNAIINRPTASHHQTAWHRDLPYQNFVISRPLALSALIAVDEFSEETGATEVLPFTHKMEHMPSDAYISANRSFVSAPAGSAIVFDSMLFHRAGLNRSGIIRRGVNNVYSSPIIKQNYDFPRALGTQKDLAPATERLLGYTSQVPLNDRAWRNERAARLRDH